MNIYQIDFAVNSGLTQYIRKDKWNKKAEVLILQYKN